MTCPQHDALSAYADQALSPRAQARLHQHLQSCPTCQQHLAKLQALHRHLRALPSATLGFDLGARLQERLQRTPRPPPPRPGLWPTLWAGVGLGWIPATLTTSAALACGVWLGGLLLGSGTGTALPRTAIVRVFDPVPPGGLCAATELCRLPQGMP